MSTFLSKVSRHIVDQNKVGDIYILVFKGAEAIRKIAHHAILIDVAGTTNESHFMEFYYISQLMQSIVKLNLELMIVPGNDQYSMKVCASVKLYYQIILICFNPANGQWLYKSS
jgi:hypothetical protein